MIDQTGLMGFFLNGNREFMPTPDPAAAQIIRQLAEFAGAAEIHAQQQHEVVLQPEDWHRLDMILDRERLRGDVREQESLALCYGAWIGQMLVTRRHAAWTGLYEPVPPRICLHGACYSPIDAVRRRLNDAAAPALQDLIRLTNFQSSSNLPNAREFNRSAWDSHAKDFRFVNLQANEPMSREQAIASLDPWLARIPLAGLNVLCLAAGGGTHGPLFACVGARVTVVDFSSTLLAVDEQAARNQQLDLTTIRADLCDLSALPDRHFDIVVQPVSACYIPDLQPMYAEIARVLKLGGHYFSQQKSPGSLQTGEWNKSMESYVLRTPAVDGISLTPESASGLPQREPGMMEYIHTLDALLGGLCRNGFSIEEVQEPTRGDGWAPPGTAEHRATFSPPYLKILSRRIGERPDKAAR